MWPFKRNQETFRFRKADGCQILERYAGKDEKVTVPSEYEGLPVTGIGENAFYDHARICEIVLPDSITGIGPNAFRGCKSLKKINLPDSLEEIGEGAFALCAALEEVQLPEGVKKVPVRAFYKCTGITQINIPDAVTAIGDEAFMGCAGLQSVILGSGLSELGDKVFTGCAKTLSIVIMSKEPKFSEKSIAAADRIYLRVGNGLLLFAYHGHDTSIVIEDEICSLPVQGLGERLFYRFAYLERVTLPKGLKFILPECFAGCVGLEEITFPDSLVEIGRGAFAGSGLKSLTIPASVQTVGENAFFASVHLSNVCFMGECCDIRSGAFSRCGLTSVSLPSRLTEIQTDLFRDDRLLASIDIPETVEAVWEYAFSGTGLECAILPENTEVIGEGAFLGIKTLKTVLMGEKIREIGKSAFALTPALEEIRFVNGNEKFRMDGGMLMDVRSMRLIAMLETKADECVQIPEGVAEIGDCAFTGIGGVKEIVVPASVRKIGDWALREMPHLERVEFLSNPAEIGEEVIFGSDNAEVIADEDVKRRLFADMEEEA